MVPAYSPLPHTFACTTALPAGCFLPFRTPQRLQRHRSTIGEAKTLINGLLQKDPLHRMGAREEEDERQRCQYSDSAATGKGSTVSTGVPIALRRLPFWRPYAEKWHLLEQAQFPPPWTPNMDGASDVRVSDGAATARVRPQSMFRRVLIPVAAPSLSAISIAVKRTSSTMIKTRFAARKNARCRYCIE